MSLINEFYEAVDALQKKIRDTQEKSISAAAEAIADCISSGGQVHIFDSGHIINNELITRAGGFAFIKRFNYTLNVESNKRARTTESEIKLDPLAEARVAFAKSSVRKGDVFILGSVSGKSARVVDIALCAKEAGCTLISVTSVEYSSQLKSDHPSGKRLFELGDIVLDNCAPAGDAMIEVKGIEHKCFPASGLAAAYMLWAVCADAAEKLLAKGISPSVYKSVNFPGGPEEVKRIDERYAELGY
ncbi:MAG: sugar isomerase domain-containing protein [Clostridia bacterium]|nr:sugar isomerase domain-containing protein [Clostridia bacterium]